MNKTKIGLKVGIVLVLFAVLTVSTVSAYDHDQTYNANATYFVPENITLLGHCSSQEVGIWVNSSVVIKTAEVVFNYTYCCANATDYTPDPQWNLFNDWNPKPYGEFGAVRICAAVLFGLGPGPVHIGNITLHCCNESYCETDLTWNRDTHATYFEDAGFVKIHIDTYGDGTFTCGTPAETYTISGYATTTGELGGEPADTVNITNLNNSKEWAAEVNDTTGFYNLTLNVNEDVNATEILRIIACDEFDDNNASNCNRTDHKVVNAPGEETVNLLLNHYCQNYLTFPYRTWNDSNWSGPAAMEMLIDHYLDDVPNQTVLNETGIGHNQDCNNGSQFVDPRGMRYTLNDYLYYPYSPYVAHYGIGSYADVNDTLHYMCKWHYLGPGSAPAYGDYSNWMVVRGIHTNTAPSFTQGSYEIYGFWINDPKDPGGIGENTYKSVEQWKDTYHKMLNVNSADIYNGTYVAVCEPPEDDDVEVTLAKAKPRLAEPITAVQTEKMLVAYSDTEQEVRERKVNNDGALKIVKAAIDGVNEELAPYDTNFAAVFAETIPDEPAFVSSDNGDYYIVPFNEPVEQRPPVKVMPVKIEKVKKSGLTELEHVKCVDAEVIVEPIEIEPIEENRTLVVVLVDVADGSFKEASWVANSVKYLPVSKVEALELALAEIDITDGDDLAALGSKPAIELVCTGESPYYPDWKITIGVEVFYVGQDGTVSS